MRAPAVFLVTDGAFVRGPHLIVVAQHSRFIDVTQVGIGRSDVRVSAFLLIVALISGNY
jgi:hypothetical protein